VKITENFTKGNSRKSQNFAINKVKGTFVWEFRLKPKFLAKITLNPYLIMANYYMKYV